MPRGVVVATVSAAWTARYPFTEVRYQGSQQLWHIPCDDTIFVSIGAITTMGDTIVLIKL